MQAVCFAVVKEAARPPHLVWVLTLAFAVFVGGIIYLANQGTDNALLSLVHYLPWGDKLGHFFLFGLLSLLLNIAFGFRSVSVRFRKLGIYVGSLAVLLFTAGEEFSQGYIASRTLDPYDYLADLAGVAVFAAVTWRIHSSLKRADLSA